VNIILFGPPGAGKGTQANYIADYLSLYKISTGDLLRKEIQSKTELGKKIKSLINKGSFVSDQIINDLVENILSTKSINNRLIFDGYPRNLPQARNLDLLLKKHEQKILCVFSLSVNKKTIIKRIVGRQVCSKCGKIFNEFFQPSTLKNHSCGDTYLSKRSDDNEKIIISRFDTYINKTLPILEFYKKQKLLYEINGEAEISAIYKEIMRIIASLDT
jgi:adenylate kinase